ncbi:MAG: hypothetical protein Q9207_003703 [Kuettlingeria erythrocarpa]
MARSELYPNTKGQLRLRLSPSRAFQAEGKLLAPIVENESGYTAVDSTGGTLEDWWKAEMLDKWLSPDEEVWAVKIFDSILVKDGTDLTKKPQKWDLSALQDTDDHETDPNDDNGDAPENWSIPPVSLSNELADIAHRLLNIDPRASSEGILLHVLHRHPAAANGQKGWLRWTADHSTTHFLTQVLYKIDGDSIAIYPGDHEETTDSMRALVASTARGLREAVDYEKAAELGHVKIRSYLSDEEGRRRPSAKKANQEASSPNKKKKAGGGGNKEEGADEPPPAQDSTITITSSTDSSSSATWDPTQVRALEGEELEEALRKQRNNPFAKPRSPTRVRDVDVTVGPRPLLLPPPARETDHAAEMGLLRQRLTRAENEVLEREHRCRVCGVVFTQQTEETVLQHISSHEGHFERCTYAQCHCPLELLNERQTQDHLSLHPNASATRHTLREGRHQDQEPGGRSTATQTNPFPHWEEPKPLSNDSANLKDHPSDQHRRTYCNKCKQDVTRLSEKARATHATKCKTTPSKFVESSVKQDDEALAARHAARNAKKEPRNKGKAGGDQTEATSAAVADAPESSKRTRGGKDRRRTTRTGAKAAEETENAAAGGEEEDAEAPGEDDGAPEENTGKAPKGGKEKNKNPEGETSAPGRRQTRKGKTPVREEETSTAPPAKITPVKKTPAKKAPAPSKSTTGAATGNETTAPTPPRRRKGRPPKKAPETIRVTDAGVIHVDPVPTPAAADANPSAAATRTATDYSSLKNSELADMLKARGLHYSGNKAALVARLEKSDGDGAAGGVERQQAAESSKTGSKQGGEEVPVSQEGRASAAEPTDGGVPDAELLGPETEGEDENDDGAETTGKGKRKRKETGQRNGATEAPKKQRKQY